jgi:hypothetical protein
MSSEALLLWLSAYPKQAISQQVIDRACSNIELSKGKKVEKVSELRFKYLSPLLEFGSIDRLNEIGSEKYYVSPTTLLHIDNKCTCLSGAVDSELLNEWYKVTSTAKNGSQPFFYANKLIKPKVFEAGIPISISKVDTLEVLKSLPSISSNLLSNADYKDTSGYETFDIQKEKWYQNNSPEGVFRHSNLPPSAESWYFIELKNGRPAYFELSSPEQVSIAMSLLASSEDKIKMKYDSVSEDLSIKLPRNIHFPLLLQRPLRWLDCSSGSISSRGRYKNVTRRHLKEISRILKTEAMDF